MAMAFIAAFGIPDLSWFPAREEAECPGFPPQFARPANQSALSEKAGYGRFRSELILQ